MYLLDIGDTKTATGSRLLYCMETPKRLLIVHEPTREIGWIDVTKEPGLRIWRFEESSPFGELIFSNSNPEGDLKTEEVILLDLMKLFPIGKKHEDASCLNSSNA